jgi:hypothetical protein
MDALRITEYHDEEGYARWQRKPRRKNNMKKSPWKR